MRTLRKRIAGKRPFDPLAARLRSAGLRLTAQRLGVLQALQTSHTHPTVEDVCRRVRKRFPKISLNTVYLNLDALKRAGETSEVWIGHDAARFEPSSVPHDHAVCVRCKRILDIYDPTLRRLKIPRRLAMRFEVIRHRIDFFGLCETCRVRRRRKDYRGT